MPVNKFVEQKKGKALRTEKGARKTASGGGWVQRNHRWVYVAPKEEKSQPGARKWRAERSAQKQLEKPETVRPAHKTAAAIPNRTDKKGQPISKHRLVGKKAKTGVTRTQKRWVRRNNRWVYATGTPAERHVAMARGRVEMESRKGGPGSEAIKKARRLPSVKQGPMPKQTSPSNPYGSLSSRFAMRGDGAGVSQQGRRGTGAEPLPREEEFLFFVPGPTPGSGSWFAAPVEMLRHARKLYNPAFRR